MKYSTIAVALACITSIEAFVPFQQTQQSVSALAGSIRSEVALVDERTGKPTGTSFLPDDAIERGSQGNAIEKFKFAKDGTSAWKDVYEYAAKIRAGELNWEDVEKGDMDNRLKFVGLLHRAKRTPGQFMMRLKVPNGIVNSDQMRFYADSVEKYGPNEGVVDITTRQNIQLRGVKLEDAPDIIDGLHARNQTTFQSALDSVRNMVGNPLAGIDDNEMVDTRELCNALNDLVSLDPVTGTRGNPMWGNLPRKFNIAVSGNRDDYAHTHINDIGLQPCPHAETGEMGFNVVLGGYMSIKRVAESIDSNMWIPADRNSVVTLCEAIIRIFRDESERKDRQKARLMWLVEKYGVAEFKNAVMREVESYKRGVTIQNSQPAPTGDYERRDLSGIHKQPDGKYRVGVLVPAGRLHPADCRTIADVADKYCDGEIRLTVEQNIILPNVDVSQLDALKKEPAFKSGSRFKLTPGNIEANLVSCTGAQFCGLALIETKSNAEQLVDALEEKWSVDKPLRIHWTGCPNSCGQVQVADIGIMGAPAKKLDPETGKNKAVPGCNIFVGGRIGEDAHLAIEPDYKNIPLDLDDLLPIVENILVEKFGAVPKKKRKRDVLKKLVGMA
mmetsp:Transcript_11049/g.16592  ORF Transcript_11049/g.16592 Transcript_11049/m.16592 type:complete len:614 (-) Transcript_11049:326-2167(-)|eukprot:CAMPEP_0196822494 /NCGR_PEP_ID=MMETSP1362-20130617/83676_1 /TAXON_ID=163516 /ORGANISM="Leptocylindrus danicus, Strain CCMP1856" /LENGTH=613 /DNA_ID=CAMNT_0042202063 /DNA_START=555 /DNA_END=2396 /DNA_ORIENTATION=+